MNREETALLSTGKPADFSFRRLKTIDVDKFLKGAFHFSFNF